MIICNHCGATVKAMADAVRHVKASHGISPVSTADIRR